MADFSQNKKYNYVWQSSKFQGVSFSGSLISQFVNDVGYITSAGSSSVDTGSFVTTSSFNSFTSSYNTGSFTGSFTGIFNGSITNAISASYALTASYFSGSITNAISASYATTASYVEIAQTASFITASGVFGPYGSNSVISSSYALTASYALNGGGGTTDTGSLLTTASAALNVITFTKGNGSTFTVTVDTGSGGGSAFPYTGSAIITGSLIVTGSVAVTQNITGSRMLLSSSNGTISGSTLTLYGSGSAQPVFTVQGSQGELFTITDSLSGSLFAVNDISGLPILEVFSDNTTLMGSYLDPMLITTVKVTQTNSGSFTVYSLPTASYDTAFFEYSVKSGSNARAGTIMAIQAGTTVNFTETTTTDIGNTSAVSFIVVVTGSNFALTGSSSTGLWTTKCIIRGI